MGSHCTPGEVTPTLGIYDRGVIHPGGVTPTLGINDRGVIYPGEVTHPSDSG